jgi:hypothetical protein
VIFPKRGYDELEMELCCSFWSLGLITVGGMDSVGKYTLSGPGFVGPTVQDQASPSLEKGTYPDTVGANAVYSNRAKSRRSKAAITAYLTRLDIIRRG